MNEIQQRMFDRGVVSLEEKLAESIVETGEAERESAYYEEDCNRTNRQLSEAIDALNKTRSLAISLALGDWSEDAGRNNKTVGRCVRAEQAIWRIMAVVEKFDKDL